MKAMIAVVVQILVGLLGGLAAGLQAPFAGIMGQKVGDIGSVFFTYCGGAILVAFVVLLMGGEPINTWRSIPWYAFFAGPLGLVIIGSLSYTVPRLGGAASTMLFVVAWLSVSAIIDHFGWLGVPQKPMDITRGIGLLILMGGTWLVIR